MAEYAAAAKLIDGMKAGDETYKKFIKSKCNDTEFRVPSTSSFERLLLRYACRQHPIYMKGPEKIRWDQWIEETLGA